MLVTKVELGMPPVGAQLQKVGQPESQLGVAFIRSALRLAAISEGSTFSFADLATGLGRR